MDVDDLTYETAEVDGRLVWLFSDGRSFPVIRGGIDDGGAGDGDGDETGNDSSDGDDADDQGNGKVGDEGAAKVEFTPEQQKHLAKLISDERAKARKSAEAAAKKAIDKAAERAKMDELERLKAEAADKDKATSAVNARLVRTEAKVVAIAEQVDPKRVDRFMRLVDLDDVTVGDDGEPDSAAIKAAVKAAKKENPEFVAKAAGNGASGGEFNDSGAPEQLTRADLKGMSPKEIAAAKKEGRLRVLLGQT